MAGTELVRFGDITEQALAWTRPHFFALQFELVCEAGVLMRISVRGLGGDRHVLAETADQAWRYDVFPLGRDEVLVTPEGAHSPMARYGRSGPVAIRFESGESYRFRPEAPPATTLEDEALNPIFTMEPLEFFPRWKFEIKLAAGVLAGPQLPVLLAFACTTLAFGRNPFRPISAGAPAIDQALV